MPLKQPDFEAEAIDSEAEKAEIKAKFWKDKGSAKGLEVEAQNPKGLGLPKDRDPSPIFIAVLPETAQPELEARGDAANTDEGEKAQKIQPTLKAEEKNKKERETEVEPPKEQNTDVEEEPSSGPPQNSSGEDYASLALEGSGEGKHMVEVHNDFEVAIEIELSPSTGWKVLYPEGRFRFETPSLVDVSSRLREYHDICGTCRAVGPILLRASEGFGPFGPAAVEFIEAEEKKLEHERKLHEARLLKLQQFLVKYFSKEPVEASASLGALGAFSSSWGASPWF